MTIHQRITLLIAIVITSAMHALAIRPLRYYADTIPSSGRLILMPHDGHRSFSRMAIEIRASIPARQSAHKDAFYGVAFAIADTTDYYLATLTPHADPSHDYMLTDNGMLLTVTHLSNGIAESVLSTKVAAEGLDLNQYDNTLAAEIDPATGIVEIFAGHAQLKKIAAITLPIDRAAGRMGVVSGAKASAYIAVSEFYPAPEAMLGRTLSAEEIAHRLARRSPASVEGVWQYLDRDTKADYMRPGGNYRIAVLADEDHPGHYEIIYLDGARVNQSKWTPGMPKGTLEATGFLNHFNLTWVDATMELIADECSATIEPNGILRLDFPLLQSSIRFSRPTTE